MLKPGDRIGDWILDAPLGEGGMGTVYRAHSVLAERLEAAVKVLKPTSDPEGRARFVREAEALSRLRHPAIVRVMGFSEDTTRGLMYLTMELAVGDTLRERLDRGPMPLVDVLTAFLPLASGLEHAHDAGIFHRDLKPANIVLCVAGGVRLVDFGIVTGEEWETLTTAGHLGTLAYLPPEIYRGERPDSRTIDAYAFGLVLNEALTGVKVFSVEKGLSAAGAAAAVSVKKLQQGPLDPGEAFPETLRSLIRRATSPDPGARPTLREAREALEVLFVAAGLNRRGVDKAAGVPVDPLHAALATDLTTRVPEPPSPLIPVRKPPSPRPAAGGSRRGVWLTTAPRRTLLLSLGALALLAGLAMLVVTQYRKSPSAAPTADRAWINPKDGSEFVWIPAGRFEMGCTPGDPECDRGRWPARSVELSNGFWIARTEVTVGAYERFARETGRGMPPPPRFNADWTASDHPIVNVTWNEARAYCTWAGGALPSEEQWEYAARGGNPEWLHPWGNEAPVCAEGARNGARFDDGAACRGAGTTRVASYGRNGHGLADMAGNTWEWCEDAWQPRYGDLPSGEGDRDEPGGRRVLRGGAWVNGASYLRVSIRSGWSAGTGRDFIGFRCVRAADGKEPDARPERRGSRPSGEAAPRQAEHQGSAPLPSPETARDTGWAPGDGPPAPVDVAGRWQLENTIVSTDHGPFRNLRLGYEIALDSQGATVTGRGEKVSENGVSLPVERRTPIRLEGRQTGRALVLEFTEDGPSRQSRGTFRIDLSADGRGASGEFTSDVANTRGVTRGKKL